MNKKQVMLTDDEIEVLLDALRENYEELNDADVREPHVVFTDQRYMYTDDDGVDHYSEARDIMCGDRFWGSLQYCSYHERAYELWYPQGWNYYPGDVCPHGMYTGGSGIDWMCGPCEMGDDDV